MRVLAITGLLGLSLLLAGCGLTSVSGGQEIDIRAGERADGTMYFEPKKLMVPADAGVTFVVRNEGKVDHEFESIEKGEAGIEEVLIPGGRTRRVNWTAPSEPATYPVYCDLPGHRAAGMELTVEVTP